MISNLQGQGKGQPPTTLFNNLDLLQGHKKVSIPFRFVHNFIVLDVQLFGVIQAELIFDTGAEHIILFKREYTELLGIEYDKRIPIMGSDLSRRIFALIARNSMVKMMNMPGKPADLLVLEEDYFKLDEMIGSPIAGLVGGGFFKNLVIEIDYRRNRINLHDPAAFKPPADYIALPIKIKTNKPYVNAEASLLNGEVVQVDLLLDTGAGIPLLLHNNSHPSLELPQEYIRGKLGMGLGGFLEGYIGRIEKLKVGSLEFPLVLTSFQDIDEEWLKDQNRFRNGIVGNQLLSRFHVILDYNRGQMYLKPYKTKQEPFDMDRSGLTILAFGLGLNEFVIRDILENSPGAEAGLLPGDVIVKLQGFPSRYYTLTGISQILQRKPGKKINLVISRDGNTLYKSFTLRDLI
jgi:hypothetical protein